MKKILMFLQGLWMLSFISCAQQNKATALKITDKPIAFPGADGFGKWATGGRGGKVMKVTSLADDGGAGTFRWAMSYKGAKIVVFAVSGTIHLTSPLAITANTTVAGQTAPGDGICFADHPVGLKGNNIIVRYVRFRMGDRFQNKGMIDGAGGDDAFSGTKNSNVIIDHCSMSWSTDEACSVYAGDSTTLQWNLIAEPMNYSYHFETGDKDFEHHGYGGIWGGRHLSAHHNLFAHCNSRTPRFDGARNIPSEFVDFRNNVIYDWGHNNAYAGEGGSYNLVANYYKWGPSTDAKVKAQIVNPYKKLPRLDYGKFYVAGNYIDGSPEVTADNWKGVVMNEGSVADIPKARADAAFEAEPIPSQTAGSAYKEVLKSVGASYRRDTLDQRIIKEVEARTGRMIDVQGGYAHGTPYEQTIKAWPALKSLPAPADGDGDGMPDDWEKKNGLNPADASDASAYKLDKGFTNIEVYINSLEKNTK